jgi:hypothetical protein
MTRIPTVLLVATFTLVFFGGEKLVVANSLQYGFYSPFPPAGGDQVSPKNLPTHIGDTFAMHEYFYRSARTTVFNVLYLGISSAKGFRNQNQQDHGVFSNFL